MAVQGLSDVAGLGAGWYHTCVWLGAGSMRCWGSNQYGSLGDGTTTSSPTPIAVPGMSDVVDVAGGSGHACARSGDGSVRCWGSNQRGQVGDWTTIQRLTPALVWDL